VSLEHDYYNNQKPKVQDIRSRIGSGSSRDFGAALNILAHDKFGVETFYQVLQDILKLQHIC